MKKQSLVLFVSILFMTSCAGNASSNPSNNISLEPSSKQSSSEANDSYSPYADDIVFYKRKDNTCIADGSFVDPEITQINIPDTSLSGRKVTAVSSFEYLKKLEKISLPETVKEIYYSTFNFDCSLKEINLPSSLVKIYESAFYNCTNLKEINFPSYLEEFESSAFENCCSIKKIRIPEKVKVLPYHLFHSCSSLQDVYLPDGLENIGIDTFSFTAIENIFIPKSVTKLSGQAFRNYPQKKMTIYVEASSHPKTWELSKDDVRYHFVYNAKRSDLPE